MQRARQGAQARAETNHAEATRRAPETKRTPGDWGPGRPGSFADYGNEEPRYWSPNGSTVGVAWAVGTFAAVCSGAGREATFAL